MLNLKSSKLTVKCRFLLNLKLFIETIFGELECIPVGCIPSASVAAVVGVSTWGCLSGGVLPREVSAKGGVCPGGVCVSQHALGRGCLPQCMLGYTPLDRIHDTRL